MGYEKGSSLSRLSYAFERLGHAFPALRPARASLVHIPHQELIKSKRGPIALSLNRRSPERCSSWPFRA